MARKVRAREAEEQALDLTPMLDVTFILLIFFIVTAQFIKLPGVDISRTDAENDNNIAPLGIISPTLIVCLKRSGLCCG